MLSLWNRCCLPLRIMGFYGCKLPLCSNNVITFASVKIYFLKTNKAHKHTRKHAPKHPPPTTTTTTQTHATRTHAARTQAHKQKPTNQTKKNPPAVVLHWQGQLCNEKMLPPFVVFAGLHRFAACNSSYRRLCSKFRLWLMSLDRLFLLDSLQFVHIIFQLYYSE